MNYKKYSKRIKEMCIDSKRYYHNGVKTDLIIRNDGYVYKVKGSNSNCVLYVKQRKNQYGYLIIDYTNPYDGLQYHMSVHRMVAQTFIYNDDPENKVAINHIDGNKCNNNVYNLEWVTPKDNMNHAITTGLRHVKTKSKEYSYVNSKMKINEDQIHTVCKMLQSNNIPIYNIANHMDVDISIIRGIARGDLYKDISSIYNIKYIAENEINEDVVKNICDELSNTSRPINEIAEDFNVNYDVVYNICIGVSYGYISVNYDLSDRFELKESTSRGIVHNICKQIAITDMSFKDIAEYNGVDIRVVQNIFYGLVWTDISKDYDFSHRPDPTHMLTDEQVIEICELLQNTDMSEFDIAKKVNVSEGRIANIRSKVTYKHIANKYDFSKRLGLDRRALITREQVEEICKLLQDTNLTHSEIGKKFNVDYWVIKAIKNRESWKDVSKKYDFSHRHPQINLDTNTVIQICELLQNTDMTIDEICNKYNVDKQQVLRIKRKESYKSISQSYDFSNRDTVQHITEKQALEVCRLLEKGCGRESISEKLNISEGNVRAIKERRKFTDISEHFNF